jgi:hypothetical protein
MQKPNGPTRKCSERSEQQAHHGQQEEFTEPGSTLMYHKALALAQVFFPVDVVVLNSSFILVEHSFSGSNNFFQSDRRALYKRNVRIEAARMIYKTRHNSLQPNVVVQRSFFQGPKP